MNGLPISLDAMQALDAIERRGSFAKAAEELNKATSALSYTIQKLEEQLGVTLFQRQGRRSVLTPSGKLLLLEGRKILEATSYLADQVKELANGWEPKLRIALESTSEREPFYAALRLLLEEHPLLEVDVRESVLNGGWEALETDSVDILVGAPSPVPQQKGFRSLVIPPAEMLLVASSKMPIAKVAGDTEAVSAELAIQRRVITHDTSVQQVMRTEGLRPGNKVLYVQTMEQKVQAQRAGLGVGHLPRRLIQTDLDSGALVQLLTQNRTTENAERHIAWKVGNKGRSLKRFVELLSKEYGIRA